MHDRFDRLGKDILREAFSMAGTVHSQHEVLADAQAADTWFQPDPARSAELDKMGALGQMGRGASSIFELFHEPPTLDDYRDCVRKQLTHDHSLLLDARKHKRPRPPFLRLWMLSAGRPETVMEEYGFTPMQGFPAGFFERREADAVGLVVLRDLPRTREMLLLRLMGAGAVLREAQHDLARLPGDAWERQVAMPLLIALRFEIAHDPDDESTEYLMSTSELYEQWKQTVERQGVERGLEKGVEKGLRKALLAAYEARFGAPPREIIETVEITHDTATLTRWVGIVSARSPEEIACALRAECADAPSRG